MNNRFSLLFFIKKSEKFVDGSGAFPVYMRITIDGARLEMSTNRRWDPTRWNAATMQAVGTREDARTLNAHLETLKAKVYDAKMAVIADQAKLTIHTLRDKFLGKKKVKSKMLLDVFRHHNEQMKLLVNKDFSAGTMERYTTALLHTQSFIQSEYGKDDIALSDLSYEFATAFEFWLKTVRNCSHNTSVKYISNLKKIVNLCMKHGWLQRDPFTGYKMNKREVVREFLSQEEIELVFNKTFATERLSIVRDIFIFSCFTGLCYADIKKLKRSEIINGIDGEKWINTKRQKTDTVSRIPLLPIPLQILDRYKDNLKCEIEEKALPVLSNQKMNAYLKEIADVVGIQKQFTFHCARHTFATTVTLTNGVPIESVSKMLGHRNLKTTQHYAKILDLKVSEDMKALRNRLNPTQITKAI